MWLLFNVKFLFREVNMLHTFIKTILVAVTVLGGVLASFFSAFSSTVVEKTPS